MKTRDPGRFEALKEAYGRWEAGVPPIPADAKASLVYTAAEMAKPF
jgi:hypothetical protein